MSFAPVMMWSISAAVLPRMLYRRPKYRNALVGGKYVSACPIRSMLDVSMGVRDAKSNPVISDFFGWGLVPDQVQKDCRRAKHWDMFSSVAVVRVRSSANARCGSLCPSLFTYPSFDSRKRCNNASKIRINSNGERPSPCLVPLVNRIAAVLPYGVSARK